MAVFQNRSCNGKIRRMIQIRERWYVVEDVLIPEDVFPKYENLCIVLGTPKRQIKTKLVTCFSNSRGALDNMPEVKEPGALFDRSERQRIINAVDKVLDEELAGLLFHKN